MLEFLPPITSRQVVLDGYAVPRVTAREINSGVDCEIVLDDRFTITLPAEFGHQVIWLVANALAIGAGYSCHGANSVVGNPYKVRVTALSEDKEQG